MGFPGGRDAAVNWTCPHQNLVCMLDCCSWCFSKRGTWISQQNNWTSLGQWSVHPSPLPTLRMHTCTNKTTLLSCEAMCIDSYGPSLLDVRHVCVSANPAWVQSCLEITNVETEHDGVMRNATVIIARWRTLEMQVIFDMELVLQFLCFLLFYFIFYMYLYNLLSFFLVFLSTLF